MPDSQPSPTAPAPAPAALPPPPAAFQGAPLEETVLRVGCGTDVKRLASAIVGVIEKEKRRPVLEFIGAGACAQAVKAAAIANTFLSRGGKFASWVPVFIHRDLADNHDTTGIQLKANVSSY